jgi:hypothetical protein
MPLLLIAAGSVRVLLAALRLHLITAALSAALQYATSGTSIDYHNMLQRGRLKHVPQGCPCRGQPVTSQHCQELPVLALHP